MEDTERLYAEFKERIDTLLDSRSKAEELLDDITIEEIQIQREWLRTEIRLVCDIYQTHVMFLRLRMEKYTNV